MSDFQRFSHMIQTKKNPNVLSTRNVICRLQICLYFLNVYDKEHHSTAIFAYLPDLSRTLLKSGQTGQTDRRTDGQTDRSLRGTDRWQRLQVVMAEHLSRECWKNQCQLEQQMSRLHAQSWMQIWPRCWSWSSIPDSSFGVHYFSLKSKQVQGCNLDWDSRVRY